MSPTFSVKPFKILFDFVCLYLRPFVGSLKIHVSNVVRARCSNEQCFDIGNHLFRLKDLRKRHWSQFVESLMVCSLQNFSENRTKKNGLAGGSVVAGKEVTAYRSP
jgi:hypothetical protein